jgi:hypothetical protein
VQCEHATAAGRMPAVSAPSRRRPRAPLPHPAEIPPPLVVRALCATAWLRDQGRRREKRVGLRHGQSAHEKFCTVPRPTGAAWCRLRRKWRHARPGVTQCRRRVQEKSSDVRGVAAARMQRWNSCRVRGWGAGCGMSGLPACNVRGV